MEKTTLVGITGKAFLLVMLPGAVLSGIMLSATGVAIATVLVIAAAAAAYRESGRDDSVSGTAAILIAMTVIVLLWVSHLATAMKPFVGP